MVLINSHPIQYFAPLYQRMSNAADFHFEIWYCSDESITGKLDKGFGQEVKWNIPLLDGYDYLFLKNSSWKPSIHKGFWGVFNPSLISKLYKKKKSILVVSGWAFSTYVMAIFFGKIAGHTVCLRVETPLNQELKKNKIITIAKHLWLRFLFIFIDKFLFIGNQNRLFYERLGVRQSDLIFTPYAVDNDRFRSVYLQHDKSSVKMQLQLSAEKKIILFSGKYIFKKRPLDLLAAFAACDNADAHLVFVGDGELRPEMESFILEHSLSGKVILTGFVNQQEMPLYYKAADVFVMCSGMGETWGLSVNEAMNFGLPVIVSDTCGCAYDLVENGVNGAVFETGNINQLAGLIDEYLLMDDVSMKKIEKAALNKIDQYSYDKIIDGLKKLV